MKCDRSMLLLYAVTDRAWTGKKTLLQQVEEALAGGATCIQLREKELPEEEFRQEALAVKELCRRYHVPFLINDNVELAVSCGADGVHVGQHDMSAADVRRRIGPGKILGVSAQTVEQARQAEEDGADYLGVGAVFSTSTKSDADAVSHETLQKICAAVSIPVCAIGGIHKENLHLLKGTGIAGVALVSAIFASPDIRKSCEDLKKLALQINAQDTLEALLHTNIRGAIFDADGTLLDSMGIWDTLGEDYLRTKGKIPRENLRETFRDMSLLQAACYYRENYALTESPEKIVEELNAMIASFYEKEAPLKEGAAAFLEELCQRNIKMCIATATDHSLIRAALKRCGVLHYFTFILTCGQAGAGKDTPTIYEEALALLGTGKKETFVFEDALYALKTAKTAGFPTVGVKDPSSAGQEGEIIKQADYYLYTFTK